MLAIQHDVDDVTLLVALHLAQILERLQNPLSVEHRKAIQFVFERNSFVSDISCTINSTNGSAAGARDL